MLIQLSVTSDQVGLRNILEVVSFQSWDKDGILVHGYICFQAELLHYIVILADQNALNVLSGGPE